MQAKSGPRTVWINPDTLAERKPVSSKHKNQPVPVSDFLTLFRAFAGPLFVIGGWQIIPLSYVTGVALVYIGFVLCVIECIWEPALLRRPYQLQIALIAIVLILADAFSINVVLVLAPLTLDSYAIRTEEHPTGETIAKIAWDSHFTDLRVLITNPTDDDYRDVDMTAQPDRWNYRAAIFEENSGCQLTAMGGNSLLIVPSGKGGATHVTGHRVGTSFQAEDDAGDVFEPFIAERGYRLICAKLPSHFTVQLVFALVSVDQSLKDKVLPPNNPGAKPGTWGFGMAELLPMNKFDLLEARPSTSHVDISGNYSRGFKRYSISLKISVANGN
jgi:hypothetical protein